MIFRLLFLQVATCFVSTNGLKVTVEQAKCVQANAFIQANLFQQFTFTSGAPAVFKVNLNALIVRHCLGSSARERFGWSLHYTFAS